MFRESELYAGRQTAVDSEDRGSGRNSGPGKALQRVREVNNGPARKREHDKSVPANPDHANAARHQFMHAHRGL